MQDDDVQITHRNITALWNEFHQRRILIHAICPSPSGLVLHDSYMLKLEHLIQETSSHPDAYMIINQMKEDYAVLQRLRDKSIWRISPVYHSPLVPSY